MRDDLRQQGRGSADRSGADLGKEGDEKGEIEKGGGGESLFSIDVGRVSKDLECVERDAYGEDNIEGETVIPPAQGGEAGCEGVGKEVEVLEKSEDAEVTGDAKNEQSPPKLWCCGSDNTISQDEIDNGRYGNETHEAIIPCPIEEITGQQQETILILVGTATIGKVEDRKEDKEGEAVELHGVRIKNLIEKIPKTRKGVMNDSLFYLFLTAFAIISTTETNN